MEKINAKKAYLAPVLKVVSFNVEKGFQQSGNTPSVSGYFRMTPSSQSSSATSTAWNTGSTEGWF